MRTLIVYYSLSGNVRQAAEQAAALLDAVLLPLEPEKAYPGEGFKKFFWGGKSAVMKERPSLRPYAFDPAEWDRVLLACPIWAGSIAPPLRSFLTEQKDALRGKRIAALFCCSGGGTAKAARQLRELAGVESLEAELTLVDPKDKPDEGKRRSLEAFCRGLES